MSNIKSVLKQNKTPLREFAGHCGIACAIAIIASLGLLCIVAAIRTSVNLPFASHQPITTGIAVLATLFACYLAGKRRQRNGLLLGATVGLLMFILLEILSAIFVKQPLSGQTLIKLLALLCAGGLGGIWGVSKATKLMAKKIKV